MDRHFEVDQHVIISIDRLASNFSGWLNVSLRRRVEGSHQGSCNFSSPPRTLNSPTCLQPFARLEHLLVLLQKNGTIKLPDVLEPLSCRECD